MKLDVNYYYIEYFTDIKTSPLPVKGCKIILKPILFGSCHTPYDMGPVVAPYNKQGVLHKDINS
jgi:hypothetical protein